MLLFFFLNECRTCLTTLIRNSYSIEEMFKKPTENLETRKINLEIRHNEGLENIICH